jgi:hypothetical protein
VHDNATWAGPLSRNLLHSPGKPVEGNGRVRRVLHIVTIPEHPGRCPC